MNKKVAILTLPLHHNFGGNLQVYALSNVLKDLGYNPDVINIKNKSYDFFSLSTNYVKQIIKIILGKKSVNFILLESEKKKLYRNHKKFIEEKLNLTKQIDKDFPLSKMISENSYHAVIVGSDQVWRKDYTPNIYNYFLDFVDNSNIRKISYAASFGLSEWQYDIETTKQLKKLAKEFDYISVRESDAVDLCKQYLEVDSENVLDPTLLLSKEKYLALAEQFESKSNNKLFTYILDSDSFKDILIRKISEEKKLEICTIELFKIKKTPILFGIEDLVTPHIETWLANFRDAEFIVTDSFHGMVFSIIFNKQFLVFVNQDRGASRFYSLLNFLGLEDRLIVSNSFDISNLAKIDYSKINELINERVLKIKDTLVKVIK